MILRKDQAIHQRVNNICGCCIQNITSMKNCIELTNFCMITTLTLYKLIQDVTWTKCWAELYLPDQYPLKSQQMMEGIANSLRDFVVQMLVRPFVKYCVLHLVPLPKHGYTGWNSVVWHYVAQQLLWSSIFLVLMFAYYSHMYWETINLLFACHPVKLY